MVHDQGQDLGRVPGAIKNTQQAVKSRQRPGPMAVAVGNRDEDVVILMVLGCSKESVISEVESSVCQGRVCHRQAKAGKGSRLRGLVERRGAE